MSATLRTHSLSANTRWYPPSLLSLAARSLHLVSSFEFAVVARLIVLSLQDSARCSSMVSQVIAVLMLEVSIPRAGQQLHAPRHCPIPFALSELFQSRQVAALSREKVGDS